MSKPLTARRLAIKLIQPYVLRGDTIEDLRQGQMGQGDMDYMVAIGGYRGKKYISPDWIVVSRLNGRPYFAKFKLTDIIKSIKRGATA